MGKKHKYTWGEAKKLCRLNQGDIQMAKELGMTPKSLVKNIPSPSQMWKSPVKVWVRDIYEHKFGKVLQSEGSKRKERATVKRTKTGKKDSVQHKNIIDSDLPF